MHNAPYDDPGVEIWAIARHQGWTQRTDVLFEMHDRAIWADYLGEPGYAQKLNQLGIPVWMREHHDDIRMSRAFPFDLADHWFGRYYTGSPSYMLALAIVEGADRIELYGINGKDRAEYIYQRPYGALAWYNAGADHALKAQAGAMAGVPV
jgi:hypothetical protein